MSYYTKITTAGLAAITAAMNNSSKVPITYMAFGDGNGYIPEPDENATSLLNEVYRVGVNKVEVHSKNPNWLVCEAIIPSAVGGFNIREVALYDSTGNTMLAIASYPPTYKPTVEEGAAKIQTIRIVLQVDNTGHFELIIDPDIVLATIEYVDKTKTISVKSFGAIGDGIHDDSDAFQSYIDWAISNGSHKIFIPFDRGEIYRLTKTININASGFEISGNRSPTYFRQTNEKGYIFADDHVIDFFNYNNGAVSGVYSSNQLTIDGIGAKGNGWPRKQRLIKHDTDNNGPHRGILFIKTSAKGFADVLEVSTRTAGYVGAATIVLESGCVFNQNDCTVRGNAKVYGLRVSGIQSEQGSKFKGIFDGGVTFKDVMLEGQTEPIDISADLGNMVIENCYFEANTGEFVARYIGTSAPATFNLRNNFFEHMDNVVDIFRLSGVATVNASESYKIPGGRKSLISLIGVVCTPDSISNGRYYVGVTGVGVDGSRGYHSPKLLNPPRDSAVCASNLGEDKIQTPYGLNPNGLRVTGTSAYLTVNQAFNIGDVMTVCALVKVKAGDSPQMQVFSDTTSSMTHVLGVGIQDSFGDTWQIMYSTGYVNKTTTNIRIRFTSNSELVVAAIGADKVIESDFETFNNVKRACIQLFNPFVIESSAREFKANPTYTLPELAAGASHEVTTSLIVYGADIGDIVQVAANKDLMGVELFARVHNKHYIAIKAINRSSAPVNLGQVKIKVQVFK